MVEIFKICNRCGLNKPSSEYYKGYAHCKTCYKEKCAKYHKNHREEICKRHRQCRKNNPKRYRDYLLRGQYGLSLIDYNKRLEKQNGVCAICGNVETEIYRGRIRPLAVDHNHKTGKIRGLLCGKCNKVLGLFHDNATYFAKAIQYLMEG